MEHYCHLFVQPKTSASDVVEWLETHAQSQYGLSIDELQQESGFVVASFLGDSSAPEQFESLMEDMSAQGSLIKGWVSGDEDPWCLLLTVTEGAVEGDELDGGLFEHLAECDEEEIEESETLSEAYRLGASGYFAQKLSQWRLGLEGMDLSSLEALVSGITDYSGDDY